MNKYDSTIIDRNRTLYIILRTQSTILATANPVPPTTNAPLPPTKKGLTPTPFKVLQFVCKPTDAIADPKQYFDKSSPINLIALLYVTVSR